MYTMALDIALLAEQSGEAAEKIAATYFDIQERINGNWLLAQITALPAADFWDRRARTALFAGFYNTLRSITHTLIKNGESAQDWATRHDKALAKVDSAIAELRQRDTSLATLSVVLGEIAALGS